MEIFCLLNACVHYFELFPPPAFPQSVLIRGQKITTPALTARYNCGVLLFISLCTWNAAMPTYIQCSSSLTLPCLVLRVYYWCTPFSTPSPFSPVLKHIFKDNRMRRGLITGRRPGRWGTCGKFIKDQPLQVIRFWPICPNQNHRIPSILKVVGRQVEIT